MNSRSGWASTSSSSLRFSRTSLRCPGSSATSAVTDSVDSRSLPRRHSVRRRPSEPIAEVLARSIDPAADRSFTTWVSRPWSIRSPDRSECRMVGAIGLYPLSASARVMLVPLPPKSHTAITPRVGTPGLSWSATSAATASGTSTGSPKPPTAASSVRSASTWFGRQCAGWVTVIGSAGGRPPVRARSSAAKASASTVSPRCDEPSGASIPTGSPTRSTKSVRIRPRSFRLGFSLGTPTSAARCGKSVSTGDRVTAARPTTTAVRFVDPIDNPIPSAMSPRFEKNPIR